MSEAPIYRKISSITFGMFSPKIIKKMAKAKVVTPELYDKEGYPVDGGLMDTRLGVIDPGLKCRTDGLKLKDCLGHFGYIELARPVIHIKFVSKILNILRSIDRENSRLLLPENKIKVYRAKLRKIEAEQGEEEARIYIKKLIATMKATTKSPHSNAKQYPITLEKPSTFMENDKRLTPIEIRTRLEKIPDDDLELLGLNPEVARPEWMVLTVLSIPPVTMRPSITLESGERSEDDLTHKLGDIVRINQRLFENINAGAPEIIIEDLWDLLQYHVTTFFDNDVAQLPPARHRSGQPLKTITERIKSKEGRIRYNLAGKRTNFSARTVISPDPMIAIDEVGVPRVVAMKLSVPETLTEWNMAYLKKFVERGPGVYPGANYIVRPDGKKKKITEESKEQVLEELQPGYHVERHLMDGDIAVFNRQPSLHRMSMMCHRIRVLPGRTFRLNPAVCAPYNADFDGDEMNLHIPQTEEARAEAELLMEVETQLISPRYGLSIIGCVQDAISGNYMLTKELSFDRQQAAGLLFSIGVSDFSKLPKKDIITGKELFSVLLPSDFSFNGQSNDGEPVKIKNGKVIKGHLDKATLGEGQGLLLRTIHKKYGAAMTIKILGNIFKLGTRVLQLHGFTTPISDTDLPAHAKAKIKDVINRADVMVAQLIEDYHAGKLDAFPSRSLMETLELRILDTLNQARNETGQLVATYSDQNSHTMIMASSGARGNLLNLAQMAACVGQQAMRGKRIDNGYNDTTLSAFKKHDRSSEARGFIKAGFKNGLSPSEFFFMGMTGRDSLMDTALRTPKSGYLYRRLANAMQDLKVDYDHTVRDATNKMIQFKYGEDGIDVSRSEGGKINVKRIVENVLGI
ncbi:MAG: DNA-directed RNA polymerase subunit A' [DPANN group archaeon]|nr:DNA-directed RNA polymerase subunit A' [DPANN group archaeon]